MFKFKEIHTDQAKVNIALENGRQFIGYVLKMDLRNNLMDFLQDSSFEPIQFPLDSVVRVDRIQERPQ